MYLSPWESSQRPSHTINFVSVALMACVVFAHVERKEKCIFMSCARNQSNACYHQERRVFVFSPRASPPFLHFCSPWSCRFETCFEPSSAPIRCLTPVNRDVRARIDTCQQRRIGSISVAFSNVQRASTALACAGFN